MTFDEATDGYERAVARMSAAAVREDQREYNRARAEVAKWLHALGGMGFVQRESSLLARPRKFNLQEHVPKCPEKARRMHKRMTGS